jgi:hypothetical protein
MRVRASMHLRCMSMRGIPIILCAMALVLYLGFAKIARDCINKLFLERFHDRFRASVT